MKCQILFYNRMNYLIRAKIHQLNPMTQLMSTSAFNFLFILYQEENFEKSLKLLESDLQQSQSGINEISIFLEQQGLIERFKDPSDKRRLKARLTQSGKEYAEKREEEFTNEENYLLSGVSDEERKVYISVAKKLYENGQQLLANKDIYKNFLK